MEERYATKKELLTLEATVRGIREDTSELLAIFAGAKVAANTFVRFGKFVRWIGGIAIAVAGIYKLIQFFRTGSF